MSKKKSGGRKAARQRPANQNEAGRNSGEDFGRLVGRTMTHVLLVISGSLLLVAAYYFIKAYF